MAPALRQYGWVFGLIICAVVVAVLLSSQQVSTKPGIERRPDCFYLIGDGVVSATPVPGCPTRPPGRPGPSLTP
jgi:hypothetical protein